MSSEKTKKSDYFLFAKNISHIAADNGGKYAFADALGVVYDSVRRWCIGETLPGGSQLLAIRDKFGVSIDWLLTGRGSFPVMAPGIHESPDSPYGTPQQPCPFCGDMTDEIKALCKTMKEIIESKHPAIVPALESNIKAFKYSMDQEEELRKLKEEVKHLKKLSDPLRVIGTGRAAGAGMRKRKM